MAEQPDLGAIYKESREAFTATVQALPEDIFAKKLPATPTWTVKDLVGHVSGLLDDVSNGRLVGAGTDAWTAVQIASARALSVEQLLERWNEQGPNFETLLSSSPPSMMLTRPVIDLVTHRWDLAGLTGDRPELDAGFDFSLNGYASSLGYRIKKAGMPAVELSSGTWTYVAGEGDAETSASADTIEIFRALAGRRSERQVLGWDWDGEPNPYLEVMSNFGDLAYAEVNEAL